MLLASLGLGAAGCDNNSGPVVPGDREEGRRLIASYGCGSCHRIPGVRGATGKVGPILKGVKSQAYLAGVLPNTFDNLVLWLTDTQRIAPGSAMPDLGVSEKEAMDMASYLYQPDG